MFKLILQLFSLKEKTPAVTVKLFWNMFMEGHIFEVRIDFLVTFTNKIYINKTFSMLPYYWFSKHVDLRPYYRNMFHLDKAFKTVTVQSKIIHKYS